MSVLSEDEMRAQLRRQNIPARLIERAITMAKARGDVAGAQGIETPDEESMADALEDEHQAESRKLMRALGFEVVSFSQKRNSKQTPGIPDTKYYHRGRRLTLWHEDKATWGRQSPAQKYFQEMAEACGEIYVLGKHQVLKDWLVEQGIAAEESGLLVPLPYTPIERSA
jgi:hypothetical protein